MYTPKVQFEAYLAKMAVETLKMTAEEYQALKMRNNQRRFMETLYQRARAMNVTMHDLEALYLSLLHDHKVASRTHLEWQPPEVRPKIAALGEGGSVCGGGGGGGGTPMEILKQGVVQAFFSFDLKATNCFIRNLKRMVS